jgi:hypothetical protein
MPEARTRKKDETKEPVAVGSRASTPGDKPRKKDLNKAANVTLKNGKKVWWNGFRAVEVD